jgi:ADP-heptose:LPS heptosyltransferase
LPGALSRVPFLLGRTLLDSAPGRTLLRAIRGTPTRPRSLLILRLDGIGDYVLFRNFLTALRASTRFRDHHVTLCGNALWRELAEALDRTVVDRFVWIDTRAFQSRVGARLDALGRLLGVGAETILQPRHSREAGLEDAIVSFLRHAETLGSAGDTHNIDPRRKTAGDRLYDRLLRPASDAVFEFEANRSLFEQLLEERLPHVVPHIERRHLDPQPEGATPHAVLVPGAGEARRRWSPERFAEVAEFLLASTSLRVLICGGPEDRAIAARICRGLESDRIADLTGRATLPQLVAHIAHARVLVSNDTGATHIAAATGTRALCVSNGNHYGRFTEYPPRLATCVTTVYPPAVEGAQGDPTALIERYRRGSFEDIDAVSAERVIAVLRTMI